MSSFSYLHLGEKINKEKNIIAIFRIESYAPLEEAASEIAAESSIGTWTSVGTLNKKTFSRLAAKVFDIKKIIGNYQTETGEPFWCAPKKGKCQMHIGVVKIAYPLELFELGNIPQLLSSVAGNIFGMKKIESLRLEDLDLPEEYVRSFKGPQLGLDGIRKVIGVKDRPLIGSIVKPKIGLSSKEHAKVAYECFLGGVDLVKDDENLTDQNFNRFNVRVKETLRLAKKAAKKTRGKNICAFNVTSETGEMIKRAKFIKKSGGSCAMVDIVTLGFGAIQSLREEKLGLIIHGHRAMHAALTRNTHHGVSMMVIAKLARLAGIDQLHTGTVVGKMEGEEMEVLAINKFLISDWHGLKPVLPIASGGLHPGLVPELIKILGKEVIINFGGGIHGHPEGTLAGAKAARQALEAAMKKIPLKEYAGKNKELEQALERWV